MINYLGEETFMYKVVVFNLVIPLFNTNYAGQIGRIKWTRGIFFLKALRRIFLTLEGSGHLFKIYFYK